MMRRGYGLLILLLAATICLAGNDKNSSNHNYNWELPAGSRLEIRVNAADLNVLAGPAGKVGATVSVHSRNGESADEVKTEFSAQGPVAMLTVHTPHQNSNVIVTVKVPAGTDLTVRSSAGDIDVETPGGSKDIRTSAGDVKVNVGSPKDYASIDVSTHAGDVSGAVCGTPKGWIGNSLECHGEGKDNIRVRTTAGDIELREVARETATSE